MEILFKTPRLRSCLANCRRNVTSFRCWPKYELLKFLRSHKMGFIYDLNLTSGVLWRIWKFSSDLLDYLHVSQTVGAMLLLSVAGTNVNNSHFSESIEICFLYYLNLTSGVLWRISKYSLELLYCLHVSLTAGEMLLYSVACTNMNYSNVFGPIKWVSFTT